MRAHKLREQLDDSRRTNAPGNIDRQTLAGVLVDDREALQLLAVGAGVVHEVIGPDVIRALPFSRCARHRRAVPAL